jgi:O-acetyl-ADP-ribose deacetylase (regulator of RNase III)
MIHIVSGDLLKSDCTIIGHQCNCLGVMGAGIAKQIHDLYPEVYEADQNYPVPFGEKRLGHMSYAWVRDQHVGSRLVCNLYGQHRYGRKGNYTVVPALRRALEKMMQQIGSWDQEEWIKIGFPYGMGAGLADGDWNEILNVIEKVSKHFNRDVYLYQLPEGSV